MPHEPELSLDPQNWQEMRSLAHTMVDDMMDYLEHIGEQPAWRSIPDSVKQGFDAPLPQEPMNSNEVYREFTQNILPYNKGNIHPRFFAWVQGTGTPLGMMADMLASAMNPNVAIGEHSAMYVDRQVVNWCKEMLGFPSSASGMLLSGCSMANITALCVARNHQLSRNVRKEGVRGAQARMLLYSSEEAHSCIQKAAEVLGLGTEGVRKIPVGDDYRVVIPELRAAIEQDLRDGYAPFCVVGNAGTVNTGAIDPLDGIAKLCKEYGLWFHVDGAFGALAKLSTQFHQQLKAIEEADSVAFDLHKWMYVNYEVGCALIRNAEAHRNSFAVTPSYLIQTQKGLAGGPDSLNNYGFELSRGFKALKVWMSLKEHGIRKYAAMIQQNINQAFYLGALIEANDNLELLTPVTMNIVCYRYIKAGLDNEELNRLNQNILVQLQERGIASPSSTVLNSRFAIRVCIVNQRTKRADLDLMIKETIMLGHEIASDTHLEDF